MLAGGPDAPFAPRYDAMPVFVTCPSCHARLKAPAGPAGRALRCPRCGGSVTVPHAADPVPAADNPFAGEGPSDQAGEAETHRRSRRPTARRKPTPGFNPFDADSAGEPAARPPRKRRYRKDADYNPFDDAPGHEEPDPAGDGFDFGVDAPPTPAGEFDFGPPGDDSDRRRRR